MSADAPLFGLVLAGGASTRMQRDKAAIEYHGQSQLHWTFHLLSHVCGDVCFCAAGSARGADASRLAADRRSSAWDWADCWHFRCAARASQGGLARCRLRPAVLERTDAALSGRAPRSAQGSRRRSRAATMVCPSLCARSGNRPLASRCSRYVAAGKQCPRKFLINADTLLLDLPDARALDNVNTSDEYRSAAAAFGGPAPSFVSHPPAHPSNQDCSARRQRRQPRLFSEPARRVSIIHCCCVRKPRPNPSPDPPHPVLRHPPRTSRPQRRNIGHDRRDTRRALRRAPPASSVPVEPSPTESRPEQRLQRLANAAPSRRHRRLHTPGGRRMKPFSFSSTA